MKPMLACDWDAAKQRFPVLLQPKIDGVRAVNLTGRLTGRSLKEFGNSYLTEQFSRPGYRGFDGEIAAAKETHPDLCRLTTSAVASYEGKPLVTWHVFDLITEATVGLRYSDRYYALLEKINSMPADLAARLHPVPQITCSDIDAVEYQDDAMLDLGYEGSILRDPNGAYKSGRSTIREGGLLRIKRFADAEGIITAVHEGQTNGNEATINELGHTERSTHQANMTPNGMVGTLTISLLQPISAGGKTLPKGADVIISAGRLTGAERAHYLANPNDIIGKIAKFQYFPKGVKDKLRFPTFQSIRSPEDM